MIDKFLQPTFVQEKPVIQQHYYATFTVVDIFGQLLGYIRYVSGLKKKIFLINCLTMAIVNNRTITLELSAQYTVENNDSSFMK